MNFALYNVPDMAYKKDRQMTDTLLYLMGAGRPIPVLFSRRSGDSITNVWRLRQECDSIFLSILVHKKMMA
jgi:hypothetical protein